MDDDRRVERPRVIDITPSHRHGFGGHEFLLTHGDVFRCRLCGGHELLLRGDDGSIPECPAQE